MVHINVSLFFYVFTFVTLRVSNSHFVITVGLKVLSGFRATTDCVKGMMSGCRL